MSASLRRDRRTERHAATREEIVAAAWSLARARGLAGWSLRDVAEAVGMRAPSLYGYVDSKSQLYDAMFAEGYEQLLARVDAAPVDGSAVDLLHRAAHLFVEFCVEDAARFQLLFLRTLPGFVPSTGSYGLALEVVDRLTAVLAAAGVTDQAAVDLWTAVLTGIASQQISNDPGGDRWLRLIDAAVGILVATRLGGVAPDRKR